MSYRILSCASCETRLRFLRDVRRKNVICPDCGQGMELTPQDLAISRAADDDNATLTPQSSPPAILPGFVQPPQSTAHRQLIQRLLIAVAIFVAITVMVVELRIL